MNCCRIFYLVLDLLIHFSLFYLAQHPGKVISRDELLINIWGTEVFVLERTVDVHIRKVREKIGDGYITTIKGVGYKFELD